MGLLNNVNYAYFGDRALPITLVLVGPMLMVLYVIIAKAVCSQLRPSEAPSLQHLVMIVSMFTAVLGMSLILVSMPIQKDAMTTYSNLRYRCDSSDDTRHLRLFYITALQLRQSPGCVDKFSVEQCEGYKATQPHAEYLKALESNFRCSGFCYEPHRVAPANAAFAGAAVLTERTSAESRNRTGEKQQSVLTSEAWQAASHPPTLFSKADYQHSCNGIAARDMLNTTRDIALQLRDAGVALMVIALCVGLSRWAILRDVK